MFKRVAIGLGAAAVLAGASALPALASSQVGRGHLFLDGGVVGTVVPPSHVDPGTAQDPLYMVTNGAAGQLGIAGVGPGSGAYHGGDWQVWRVTFNGGVAPYLLTSATAVATAQAAGDVTVTRAESADFRCPVTQQNAS